MKKLALVVLSLLMIASFAIPAMAADEGMTFSADTTHPISKLLEEKLPATFEAVIRLPKGYSERAGLMLSSYSAGTGAGCVDGITFQFNSAKNLELYYETAEGKTVRHKFDQVPVTSVATGEWVHITVVKDDDAMEARCYVDGEYVQTAEALPQPYGYAILETTPLPLCVGGDHRSGNGQYFKGEIREIAVFSDVRTADEIKADAKELKADKDMLIWYQLEKGMTAAKDLSGNGNHMGDYVEPETTAVVTTAAPTTTAPATAAQTSAAPSTGSSAATFDVAVVLATVAAFAGAGVVVSGKRR